MGSGPGAGSAPLGWVRAAVLAIGAAGSFHVAFMVPSLGWLALGYLGCLVELRRMATARQAFYLGLGIGLAVFVPQTGFLGTIFHAAAIPLWSILALFHGVFLLALQRVRVRMGDGWSVVLAPVLWCGIEYFRSEVWWLRFGWFAVGSAVPLGGWGYYGVGLAACGLASGIVWGLEGGWRRGGIQRWIWVLGVAMGLAWLAGLPGGSRDETRMGPALRVAGMQLEFPGVPEVLVGLGKLATAHPEAELLMLSEYTFTEGPPPAVVRDWCRKNRRWLVAGGKEMMAPEGDGSGAGTRDAGAGEALAGLRVLGIRGGASAGGPRFRNTAFVIDPRGEVVFTQAKSRPIQFFQDGEPATGRRVWDSPWGRLGIAICYDASYRRVMDDFIRQGAVALLVPTMDVEAWGEHEHRLNARMARIRAAEYGVPVFRVASSGISQVLDRTGREMATASFPGPGEMLAGELRGTVGGGVVPMDGWLAPACTWASGALMLWLGVLSWNGRGVRTAAG